jgi:hypothetical protein
MKQHEMRPGPPYRPHGIRGLRDVIRCLPAFSDERSVGGGKQWFIWNETTAGENFAEK